ncbi:hypothetical protein [Methanosarcina horonobensis]|uniref:hypothetical protein n=1 Tax=Methanosarcina horonobensis TaxID=418008 RepID=UPI000AC0B739|nr:hypothetical protein [Methanosarcina horonobensis]
MGHRAGTSYGKDTSYRSLLMLTDYDSTRRDTALRTDVLGNTDMDTEETVSEPKNFFGEVEDPLHSYPSGKSKVDQITAPSEGYTV